MPRTPSALIIGCGHLGVEVGRRLISRGWRVRGTTRRAERSRELATYGIEGVELDVRSPAESPAWSKTYTAVVYSVAPGRGGDPRLAFYDGALATFAHVKPEGPLIYVSSTGVYPQSDGSEVDESSPTQAEGEEEEERYRWLRRAENRLLRHDRRVSVLRLGGLYGPGRSPLEWVRSTPFRERLAGRSAAAFMNWVRIEDAAEAVALAAVRGRLGALLNIADGVPVRRSDFFGLATELAGVPPIPFRQRSTDLGKRCSSERARTTLGFAPRYPSYREGLTDLAGSSRPQARERGG